MQNTPSNSDTPLLEPLILTVRGHRVILDADLARLYGVTTKALNQALKRNINRFPADFAFQLVPREVERMMRSQSVTASDDATATESVGNSSNPGDSGNRSQIVTGSPGEGAVMWSQSVTTSGKATQKHRDPRFSPWAFTEHGVLMAANILRSEQAVEMSVYVVRAFVKLRQIVQGQEELSRRMAEAELSLRFHGEALVDIYEKLEPLMDPPEEERPPRTFGFETTR
jgi:ORF6N domain